MRPSPAHIIHLCMICRVLWTTYLQKAEINEEYDRNDQGFPLGGGLTLKIFKNSTEWEYVKCV